MTEQVQLLEKKKQKWAIVTLWEGWILEIKVPRLEIRLPKISRKQLSWLMLFLAAALLGIDRMAAIIEWAKSVLALAG